MRACIAVVIGVFATCATAEQVTPVQKVLQMLDDMLVKGKSEKENEATAFAAYETFVKDTSWDKSTAISTGNDKIDQLNADIQKASADVMQLSKDIAGLDSDVATWTQDHTDATRVRDTEHADFQATHADYTDAIGAVDRALKTLNASPGTALLQARESLSKMTELTLVPVHARKAIMAFLQSGPNNALLQDAEALMNNQPQASVKNYEGSSSGVIQMVEGLGAKFDDERSELEKKEANNRHAYDMLSQDLTSQIANGKDERESKTARKAGREQDHAAAEGDLADTTATLKEDEKFLADLTAESEQKTSDFGQRQETRAGEIEALGKAIEIMSSDSIGGGSQHLPSLVQKKVSLAQLRVNNNSPLQGSVANFLRSHAERSHSRILSFVATKVRDDPFGKVTKMIRDMITKLTEEANEEAEHKGFCDAEMSTNKATRDAKTEESDTLKAEIDQLTADIAKLAQDIADLSDAIASLDGAVSEASSLRAAEKTKNTATIADAKAATAATTRALAVLKAFYAKAAEATALTQVHANTPYTGSSASGGVVSMLEVIQSDFERLDSETASSEAQAASSHAQFTADSAEDREQKSTDLKHKENTKTQKESSLASASKNLGQVREELNAAYDYYEKLKPSCVDAGVSYAERVAWREEEIESLKEALKMLSGEGM